MATATLTSKGQTTVPQKIRNYLALHSGDKLEFIINAEGQVILIPLTISVRTLKGCLPKPTKKVTIAAMRQAIVKRGGHQS